ncbi:MAG: flagellar M-ring protein FliF [Hydrogenibacillus sp.]|nr:flagellar M-ring protein FliF [Hydrogenibacillus sp.]
MPEKLKAAFDNVRTRFAALSSRQKIGGALALAVLFALLLAGIIYLRHVDYVPVYANLSEQEIGEIVAKLQAEGIAYQISPDGRGLSVDRSKAAEVRVRLAAEGIPKTGTITYETLAKNTGMGMTDRQFSVLEREALQNELARMIETGIHGIRRAQVMLSLPEPSIWVAQPAGEASASVIVELEPGTRLDQPVINALYTLVQKSVPRLPMENIIITTQYGEALEPRFDDGQAHGPDYAKMQDIKRSIERDVESGLTRLFTPVFGPQTVVVQSFATIDFTVRESEEHLVTAPDEANQQGLVLSMEKLAETWQGQGQPPGGTAGVGTTDVPGYQAAGSGQGQYERTEDRVNYELNRITRTVKDAPYVLKDLAVNVVLDTNALGLPPDDPKINDVKQQVQEIAANVVRSALANAGQNAGQLIDAGARVQVYAYPFSGGPKAPSAAPSIWASLPRWVYAALAGAAILIIGVIVWFIMKRRRSAEAELSQPGFSAVVGAEAPGEPPPLILEETDEARIQKQLERLAREKPKDFAAVLRTWLKEES